MSVFAEAWWIPAGLKLPGLLVVLAVIGLALARVMVAAVSGRKHRRVERALTLVTYPLAIVAFGVILLRFVELSH